MQVTSKNSYSNSDINAVLSSYLYTADQVGSYIPSLRDVSSKLLVHFRQEYSLVVAPDVFHNKDFDDKANEEYEEFVFLVRNGYYDHLAPQKDDIRFILKAKHYFYYDEYLRRYQSSPLKSLW